MVTRKQTKAAKQNIKKAHAKWQKMSSREHALVQPEGQKREKPGAGAGDYYRVEVRDKYDFVTFRTHDVGDPGGLQRIAGKRSSGSWDDQAWLIPKNRSHIEDGELIGDDNEVREVLTKIGPAIQIEADRFKGHPRKNVPEYKKPTPLQRQAQMENIEKAQAARWHGRVGGKASRQKIKEKRGWYE